MATSATLRVFIKGKSEDDSEYVEFKLKENEGFTKENQIETYKETGDPVIAIWDKKILTGRGWSSGGTILLTDETRDDVVKFKQIENSVDPFVTIRWAPDGNEVGKKYSQGDAIIGNANQTTGTGTVPMLAFSLQGSGKIIDGTF